MLIREGRECNGKIPNQLETYCNRKYLLFVNDNNIETFCLAEDISCT